MRKAGSTVRYIATTLKRPVESVFARCKRLLHAGILQSRKASTWSRYELAKLQDITLSNAEVAKITGRTKAAVQTKRTQMGMAQGLRQPWSTNQDRTLIDLRNRDLSFAEIAKALGRTEYSVANRVHTLIADGLLVPLLQAERSRRGGVANGLTREDRWSTKERDSLVTLWKGGHTAQEISVDLRRSVSSISNELSKLRVAKVITRLPANEAHRRAHAARIKYSARQYAAALEKVRTLPNTKTVGYIFGVLFGDGFITIQGNRGSIGLKSTNESFCASFARALEETFGLPTRQLTRIEPIKEIHGYTYKNVRYYEAFLHSVHLGQAIRQVFGRTDEQSWCANTDYFKGIGDDFIDGVIQGFFDAEGSFMQSKTGRYYTTACSMNGSGLMSIHALLLLRGYGATINSDKRKQWRVSVGRRPDVRRFAAEIGSRIDYKAAKMRACLDETK